ncbi:HAMP domain-containing protein [Actinoplanes sp. CA-051413]|uniref:HAMP domain-containing protein n=1 Tax=Actinoplanes sp. CA-051413 TaxID=3239899 RepID=UPI003D960AAE
MRAVRRWTVRKRLFAIAAIGALLAALVGMVGLSGYARLTAASRAESRLGTIQALTLTAQSLQHQVRAQAWFAVAVSKGDTGRSTAEVRTEFDAARTALNAGNTTLSALADGTRYEDELRDIGTAHDSLVSRVDSIIYLSATDRAAALAGINTLESDADALDAHISGLIARLSTDRAAQLAAADRIKQVDSGRLLAAALLAALLVLGLSARLTRSILRDLRAVDDVAHRVGAGDLEARVEQPRDDEIGALARSFNDTADRLRETVRQLTAEARREKLGSQLADAFDMAETEHDAYGVITNSLTVLDPDRPAELLLADNSEARLTSRATGVPVSRRAARSRHRSTASRSAAATWSPSTTARRSTPAPSSGTARRAGSRRSACRSPSWAARWASCTPRGPRAGRRRLRLCPGWPCSARRPATGSARCARSSWPRCRPAPTR